MTRKPVKQINLKELSEVERNKISNTKSTITKLALHNHKIIAVFITMDIKGDIEVVHFGAGPEIAKRAKFMADSIATEIPRIIEAYDIPNIDIPAEKVKS